MPLGGRREGAGRPEGSRNKRTVEVEERAREMAAALAAVDVTNHDVKFVVSGEPIDRDGDRWAVKFTGEPTEH